MKVMDSVIYIYIFFYFLASRNRKFDCIYVRGQSITSHIRAFFLKWFFLIFDLFVFLSFFNLSNKRSVCCWLVDQINSYFHDVKLEYCFVKHSLIYCQLDKILKWTRHVLQITRACGSRPFCWFDLLEPMKHHKSLLNLILSFRYIKLSSI